MDSQQEIASGSFGVIFKAKVLELLSTRKKNTMDNEKKTVLSFGRGMMAVKNLKENTAMYENKGYKVERMREQTILKLIK